MTNHHCRECMGTCELLNAAYERGRRAAIAGPRGDERIRSPEEKEFLAASVAVWREIDRLSALPEGYQGLPQSTDPRKRELAAWEAYRTTLDTAATSSPTPASENDQDA